MSAIATVPVTIEPEAADFVARLGLQAELDRTIDHVRQTTPGLTRLRIYYLDPYDTGDAFTVRIEATREGRDQPADEELRFAFIDWQMATFPIDIAQYFFLCFPDVDDHAG